jgi:hypothetical protein
MNSIWNSILLLISLMLILNLTGCAGVMIRSMTTEDVSYLELMDQMGPISSGHSRLTIYTSGGGPNVINTMGRVLHLTIGNQVYVIGGNSYFIIDIPAGEHIISYNNVLHVGFMRNKYQKGENTLKIEGIPGEEVFVEIELKAPTFVRASLLGDEVEQIDIVTKNDAIEKLSKLVWYNEFETDFVIEG